MAAQRIVIDVYDNGFLVTVEHNEVFKGVKKCVFAKDADIEMFYFLQKELGVDVMEPPSSSEIQRDIVDGVEVSKDQSSNV